MSRLTPPAYKTRNWPACNDALKRRSATPEPTAALRLSTEMHESMKPSHRTVFKHRPDNPSPTGC